MSSSLLGGLLLTFLVTVCYASKGHEHAHELNKKNPCSGIDVDPKNLKEPILQYLRYENKEELCCPCNPGEKLVGLCRPGNYSSTFCQPCEEGTFRKEYTHGFTFCDVDQLKCGPNSIYIPSKQKPRCDCLEGYYKASDGACTPHSDCPPGEGVLNLGTLDSDTKCEYCPEGYHSKKHSNTEKCSPNQSVLDHSKNKHLNLGKQLASNSSSQTSVKNNPRDTLTSTTGSTLVTVPASSPATDNSSSPCVINFGTYHCLGLLAVVIVVALLQFCICPSKLRNKVLQQFYTTIEESSSSKMSRIQENGNDLGSQCTVNMGEVLSNRDDSERNVTHVASSSSNAEDEMFLNVDEEEMTNDDEVNAAETSLNCQCPVYPDVVRTAAERVGVFFLNKDDSEVAPSKPLLSVRTSNEDFTKKQQPRSTILTTATCHCRCCPCSRTNQSQHFDNSCSNILSWNSLLTCDQTRTANQIKTAIKNILSKLLHWEQTKQIYRHFTNPLGINPEPYLEDLEGKCRYSCERFIQVFTKLDSMVPNNFSPQSLQDFLVNEHLQQAADRIDEYVKKWKLHFPKD